MNEWMNGLVWGMVRVKMYSLSRVVPKGNGEWEIWLLSKRKAITLFQEERKINPYRLVLSCRWDFPLHFFPSQILLNFYVKFFLLKGCEEPFCSLYCNTGVREDANPFKHWTKSANWKGFFLGHNQMQMCDVKPTQTIPLFSSVTKYWLILLPLALFFFFLTQ